MMTVNEEVDPWKLIMVGEGDVLLILVVVADIGGDDDGGGGGAGSGSGGRFGDFTCWWREQTLEGKGPEKKCFIK